MKTERLQFRPDFPFDVSKIKMFYGWIILIVGIFGILMSMPGQTFGISVFTEHLIESYGINRMEISISYLVGTGLSGFLVRYVGKYYDRVGVRPSSIIAAFVLSASLFLLSQLDNINSVLSSFLGMEYSPKLLLVLLTVLFLLLRLSGQGATTLMPRNMVLKWFEKQREFVNIFMGIFVSFGFSLSPMMFNGLIELSGWRGAWQFMAIFIATIYVVVVIIFFRDSPQDCGLKPDAKKLPKLKWIRASKFVSEKDFTIKDAIQTRPFWIYTFAIALFGLIGTGFTFHVESLFAVKGLSKETALGIFIPAWVVSLVVQIYGNWLSSQKSLVILLRAMVLSTITNCLMIPLLGQHAIYYWLFIVSYGINAGMFTILLALTWPRLFGIKHLGEISGYAMGVIVIATAVGPALLSASKKMMGNYDLSAYFCALSGFVLFFYSLGLKKEKAISNH